MKNRFLNPATGDDYTWHINHRDQDTRLESSYAWSSTTGGAPQPQFGGKKAEVWNLRGTILHKEQHTEFEAWLALSGDHTIHFRDCDGTSYEVSVIAYNPTRVAVARNPQDPANMPLYIYRYEMQLLIHGPAT